MLKERDVEFTYREYTKEPLDEAEIRSVLAALGAAPRDVLRMRDAKPLGLDGTEPADALIKAMAETPSLIQRPIGVLGDRAVLCRPVENLLELI